MKRFHVLTSLLMTCLIGAFSPLPAWAADQTTAATAAEATADLFAALAADDVDRAVAMTAPVKGGRPEAVREYYQRLADLAKMFGPAQVIAHLTLGDTAVVVFRDVGPQGEIIDLDPAYLVRRDGKWLVLFELTQFDRPYLELNDAALTRFKKLQAWYDEQEPKLQALLGDGT